MKTFVIGVALPLSSSATVVAQPQTGLQLALRIGGCVNDVCVLLLATENPTDGAFLSYFVYERLTGTAIVEPVEDEPLPAGALMVNNQGTQATLITDGIALTWRATGETSIASTGSTVVREFGPVVRRFSFDETRERAQVTGTLNDVAIDHLGEIQVQTTRDITR